MTAVPLGQSTYRRRGARTAEIALVNMLLEKDPTNQVDGLVRYQRPGLAQYASVGIGPIRGVYRRFGVLGTKTIVVSGQQAFTVDDRGNVSQITGEIPGADIVCIDASADRIIIVANGAAYSTDGSTITQISMPDDVAVSSVAYISGYFILTVADSHRFYWLAPGDTNPDALNFASAENGPDNIIRAIRLLDEVWFFGQQTTEVFQLTGNADAPFQPIGGRLYERGCANRDSVYALDNTLFWIGNDLVAYRADTTPIRISDHSMEERIRLGGQGGIRAWAMVLDGHTLYCVRCGEVGTFVFDVENANWQRFKTYNREVWQAHVGAQISGDLIIAGDDQFGILWELAPEQSNDGGVPLEREVTGGVTVLADPVKCKNLSVRVAVGWADIVGEATDPLLQLSYSDDGGNLWSDWLDAPLGLQGQYLTEVVWRRLGIVRAPGRLFRVRCTEDALFRISYCRMNEAVAA